MKDAFLSLVSSKGWHYFWLAFSLIFMVVDLITGSYFLAIWMFALSVFWAYQIDQINAGNNEMHNDYHQVKN